MYRHKSSASGGLLQPRRLVSVVAGTVFFVAGCIPTEEGDASMTAAGTLIAQIVGFAADFARQLLAAYLF